MNSRNHEQRYRGVERPSSQAPPPGGGYDVFGNQQYGMSPAQQQQQHRPVTLQAQHHGYGHQHWHQQQGAHVGHSQLQQQPPPPGHAVQYHYPQLNGAFGAGYHQQPQQQFQCAPQGGGYQQPYQYHQQPPPPHGRPPPPPHAHANPQSRNPHSYTHNRPPPPRNGPQQQNFLSGNALKTKNKQNKQNRKRKKDVVQPVVPLTEEPVVRAPLNEAERQEIEAWKAERRKHWPTEAAVAEKKKRGEQNQEKEKDTRQITLGDVLNTQQRLGLLRKAGTEELYKHGKREEVGRGGERMGPQEGNHQQRKKPRGPSACTKPVSAHQQEKKKTLLERLLEKDIKSYECKVVQLFHFIHMNGYFRNEGRPLVFFDDDGGGDAGSGAEMKKRALKIEELDVSVGEEEEEEDDIVEDANVEDAKYDESDKAAEDDKDGEEDANDAEDE